MRQGNAAWLVAVVVFVCVLLACGQSDRGEGDECESTANCASGRDCLWLRSGGRITGTACVRRCADQPDCSAGETCTGLATSCAACKDNIRVCAEAKGS